MDRKKKIDVHSPEARAIVEEISRTTFTREGLMVAFPTCLPGETLPIVHDEGRITALDATAEGMIYGGTSGRRVHIFGANFHGLSGMVLDMGVVEDATECAAVCCGASKVAAFVNGPKGGRIFSSAPAHLRDDMIQEWGFGRPELTPVGAWNSGTTFIDAAADPTGRTVIGVTATNLFQMDLDTLTLAVIGEIQGSGRVAFASGGGVVGQDGDSHLWHWDVKTAVLRRRAFPLPGGAWNHPIVWGRGARAGLLYTADAAGNLFSFDETKGFSVPLGRTRLTPVGPMAVTLDGRLFGFCGDEIAKMFCYDPGSGKVSDLGVAASVVERRRYGYVFGDAVTGRDGEIVFGENDNSGHLWLYFPKIQELKA